MHLFLGQGRAIPHSGWKGYLSLGFHRRRENIVETITLVLSPQIRKSTSDHGQHNGVSVKTGMNAKKITCTGGDFNLVSMKTDEKKSAKSEHQMVSIYYANLLLTRSIIVEIKMSMGNLSHRVCMHHPIFNFRHGQSLTSFPPHRVHRSNTILSKGHPQVPEPS